MSYGMDPFSTVTHAIQLTRLTLSSRNVKRINALPLIFANPMGQIDLFDPCSTIDTIKFWIYIESILSYARSLSINWIESNVMEDTKKTFNTYKSGETNNNMAKYIWRRKKKYFIKHFIKNQRRCNTTSPKPWDW